MMVHWTEVASSDLESIRRYIARDKPVASNLWIDRLIKRAHAAAESPWLGRVVPEFRLNNVREVFLRSYRIIYRVVDEGILVLSVSHGRRPLRGVNPYAE